MPLKHAERLDSVLIVQERNLLHLNAGLPQYFHSIEYIAEPGFDFDLAAGAEIQPSTGSNWSRNS